MWKGSLYVLGIFQMPDKAGFGDLCCIRSKGNQSKHRHASNVQGQQAELASAPPPHRLYSRRHVELLPKLGCHRDLVGRKA